MTTKRFHNPCVAMTTQLPIDYFQQIVQAAEQLGISRHKLTRLAIETGFPLVSAKLGYRQPLTDN